MIPMVINKMNFPIYGIIIIISILFGMLYIFFSLKKDKYKNNNVFLYFFMYIIFSIVFGKMFTMITSSNIENILTAGLSSYGGFVGCIVASIIFERILPTNNKIIKYTIISLPLVYSLSKIACFISGCCYGIPYRGIFNVTYTSGLNIKLFPVQIVETIAFFIIFLICNKYKYKKNIIYITIIICSISKFLLDFFRYEHIYKIITVNQIFSIIILLFTVFVLIYKSVFKKEKI